MQIIIDTREQEGIWEFKGFATVRTKVETGDYALAGLEDKLCIERKRTVSELAKNIFEPRFKDVLTRMGNYPHRYIIFEFSIDDILRFPIGSNIPKTSWNKLKASPALLMRFISDIQVKYDVHVIFAGDKDNAMYVATNIMKRVHEKYSKQ